MVRFQEQRKGAAFEELYRAAAPGLLQWIEGFVATRRLPVDPVEALQDTFVNVYRYASSFRPDAPGGFRAWSRTIASNAVRRRRARPHRAGIVFSDLEGTAESPFQVAADRCASPAQRALDSEDMARLRSAYLLLLHHYAAAYRTLKDRDRVALHLVEVEGYSYERVGEHLGVGRSNTKMIVFRARQRLRKAVFEALFGRRGDTAKSDDETRMCA